MVTADDPRMLGGRLGAARSTRLQLRRQDRRERHFAVDGLLENVFDSGADF